MSGSDQHANGRIIQLLHVSIIAIIQSAPSMLLGASPARDIELEQLAS